MKHSILKRGTCLFLAMLLMFALFGCSSNNDTTDPTDAATDAAGDTTDDASATGEFDWKMCDGETINILFNQHQYVDPIVERIEEFEEMTGISVEYSIIPESNYFDKVTMELYSGSGNLDIFMTGPYQIWEYASAGYMQDLDEFINDPSMVSDDFDVDDFYPSILNSARWDCVPGHSMGEGPLWALPMGFESNELWVNTRIFEENKVEVPTTTEELLEAASALQGHSGPNTYSVAVRGERGWGTIITGYMSLYTTWGAKDFEIVDGKLSSVVNSPEAVEMTDWYVKMIQAGGSPNWATATWYDAGGDLGAGNAAMLIDATNNGFSQAAPGKSEESGNISVYPIPGPSDDAEPKSNLYTWSLCMSADSKHKEAAWLFLQYFSGKSYMQESAVEAQIINTPRQSVFESAEYQELINSVDGLADTFNAEIDYTTMYFTPNPHPFEIMEAWSATLQELVEGKYASTQEGMDALKEQIDEIVADVVIEE
jgi:multiple sugar transport system substrate-binding protein